MRYPEPVRGLAFAASPRKTSEEVVRRVNLAVEIAKGSRLAQQEPVRLVPVEAFN